MAIWAQGRVLKNLDEYKCVSTTNLTNRTNKNQDYRMTLKALRGFGVTFLVPFQLTAARIKEIVFLSFRFTNNKAMCVMSAEESGPSLSPQGVRISFRSFSFWRNLIVTFLVISPLLIRFWCLSKVPPAPIPFDVDEFCQIEIEPGQNAFDYFREAGRLKAAVTADYKAKDKTYQWGADHQAVMANGWSVATDSMKQWLLDHREAMQVWRRGTDCSDSLFASPLVTSFDEMMTALQSFQELVGMVQCDGMRLESEGRLFDAAENYLAILRSSDLLGRHGFVTQKLHGMWNYRVAARRLIRWSEDSRLGAEELRSVLNQVRAVNQKSEPPSAGLKVEYVFTMKALSRSGWCKQLRLTEKYEKFEPYASTGMEAFLWILGEPDDARRTFTHVLTNQLREIDKPLAERSPMAEPPTVGLFVPSGEHSSQSFPPAAIERAVQRSAVVEHLLVLFSTYDKEIGRDRSRRVGLELVLAAQIYFREHGEFPAETSALIPDYIDAWLGDPLQSTVDGLMQYERESTKSARIRSLGIRGFDATLQTRTPAPKEPAAP